MLQRNPALVVFALFVLMVLALQTTSPSPRNLTVGVVYLDPPEKLIKFAVQLGFLTAQKELPFLNNNFQINFECRNVTGEENGAEDILTMTELMKNVSVVFGPMEDFTVAHEARFASNYRFMIPVITAGGGAKSIDDKVKEYTMLTRVGFHTTDLVWVMKETWRVFGWGVEPNTTRNRAIFYERLDGQSYLHTFIEEALSTDILDVKWERHSHIIDKRIVGDKTFDYASMLTESSKNARVIVLCASPATVRKIMLQAYRMNFVNGEYVFINFDLSSNYQQSKKPWKDPNDTDESNRQAREAYRVLMTITLRKPDSDEYRNFSKKVKDMAQKEYNYTFDDKEEVNAFIGAFHDAVLLYALSLNDTLAMNLPYDGKNITANMWNRTFNGITGLVKIDENGDRNADYSLLDMDRESGKFEVVANYFGNDKRYVQVAGREIDWVTPDNKPPPDMPVCGFDGSGCPSNLNALQIACITMAGTVTLALIVGFLIYRHVKAQAELKAMNWIIHWDELETSADRKTRRQSSVARDTSSDQFETTKFGRNGSYRPMLSNADAMEKGSGKRSKNKKSRRQSKVSAKLPFWLIFSSNGNEATVALENERQQPSPPPTTFALGRSRRSSAAEMQPLKAKNHYGSATASMSKETKSMSAVVRYEPEPLVTKISPEQHSYAYGSLNSFDSNDTIGGVKLEKLEVSASILLAIYKGTVVALKSCSCPKRVESNMELLLEVKSVKNLNNDHICRFIGVCLSPAYIVMEYCAKSSLQDVLENEQVKLDWMFKFSLMQDICRGMIYLHNNIGPHGNLKSSNCLVDSRFVVKISDFGLRTLRIGRAETKKEESPHAYYRDLLWRAPELLHSKYSAYEGTVKGDVYSFGMICQEIVYRKGVFYLASGDMEPTDILNKVKNPPDAVPFRPTLEEDEEVSPKLYMIIRSCWEEDPNLRMDFPTIKNNMKKLNKAGDSGNILDNLLARNVQYASNLESLVEKRTEQYLEEKRKTEDLLYSMLPKSVAGQLIRGQPVQAESYDLVTIYFSDIVGFTSLSADSTAMQVIELLNRLYTTFDSIIENFDVYKVETIGDAYMVCSGLPQRNGNLHAREVARMSLNFLRAIFSFRIPHRPDKQLELRIGIHSGPVCAGVVGLKMPRYCLFGDTVNTASRMESNGLPLKIHLSQHTMKILETFGTFVISERGHVEMKGKGSQMTYWLHGENGDMVDPVPTEAKLTPSSAFVVAASAAAMATSTEMSHLPAVSTTNTSFHKNTPTLTSAVEHPLHQLQHQNSV